MPTGSGSSNSTPHSFAWLPAVVAFICLEGLVVFQAFSAYQDHFFTVAQMRGRGISQGLPFIWHFAMWGDFLVISPLAAYVIGRTRSHWRRRRIWVSFAIGIVSAVIMSLLYMLSSMPEAHIQNHHLTAAGVIHLIYMAIAIAVFMQFLFFTEDISVRLLRIVSVLLFAHVFFGTHMALGILKLIHPLDWYPAQPLQSIFGWITIGAVGLGLAFRNFGIVPIAKGALDVVLYLTHQRIDTVEGYLKFLDFVCASVLASTYFFKLFEGKWQEGKN